MTLLAIATGGAIGASLRYLAVGWTARIFGTGFPLGTLGVNVLGSFLMGVAATAILARGGAGGTLAPFVMTGILGGFTTFSAFSLDAVALIEQGRALAALAYIGLSVAASVLALALGMMLTRSALA
jgi:CrcB protein